MNTPLTLIGRIQSVDGSREDWNRFCDLYYPLVLKWSRACCADSHEAQDVAQEIFLDVHRRIMAFSRKRPGSMRTWLRRILHSKVYNSRHKRFPLLMDFSKLQESEQLSHSGREEITRHDELFTTACERIRREFTDGTWEAFYRTHVLGEGAGLVSKALGITPNAVYVARSRVILRLKQQLSELTG